MSDRGFFGIDTSNYTTSVAVLFSDNRFTHNRKLLPVPDKALGLRQSDALFAHVKALGELTEQLFSEYDGNISALGVSKAPRDNKDSYMPCFMAGVMAARVSAAYMRLPVFAFSHQSGHMAAALISSNRTDIVDKPFIAIQMSGGTTECLYVKSLLNADIEVLSQTNDLNAGQAIDRVGAMLGFAFPSGKALDELAQQSEKIYNIKPVVRNENICLSGIENQCNTMLSKGEKSCDIARFCLDSIVAAVVFMAECAKLKTGCNEIIYAGGVMSNSIIRPIVKSKVGGAFATPELSTDNAVGIAYLTKLCYERGVTEHGFDGA